MRQQSWLCHLKRHHYRRTPNLVDATFPQKTVTWPQLLPVDGSGNNGYREVEVWATTGPQYSDNTCVNKVTVAQTVPQQP